MPTNAALFEAAAFLRSGDREGVVEMASSDQCGAKWRVANELKKRDLSVSPFGVRSVWLRHDLETGRSGSMRSSPRVPRKAWW
jgi:hypothetical protein